MIVEDKTLFVCDLDGVLVQSDGTIRMEDLEQIKGFVRNGGLFVICTGRLDQDIQYVEKQIGVKGDYRISQNGAVIKDKTGEVVYHKTIQKEDAAVLNEILSKFSVRTEVNTIENRYFPSPRDPEEVAEFVDTSIVKENLFDFAETSIEPTIYLNFGEAESFEEIRKEIQETVGDRIQVVQTSPSSLEVFSNEASKGSAVQFIAQLLRLQKDQIIAAGDAENDITMFPYVGRSFAVGEKSDDLVKQAADHVANTIEELFIQYVT